MPEGIPRNYQFHFTRHSMFRGAERNIADEEIYDTVRTGAVIQTQERGPHKGLKRLYKKYIANRVIVVVAEVHKNDCWLITAYAEEN